MGGCLFVPGMVNLMGQLGQAAVSSLWSTGWMRPPTLWTVIRFIQTTDVNVNHISKIPSQQESVSSNSEKILACLEFYAYTTHQAELYSGMQVLKRKKKFTPMHQFSESSRCKVKGVSTNLLVGSVLQHRHASNCHVVHFMFSQCYL